tara:strand:+ start:11410 stop:11844 length:435 start_codon:yes stop_codon:yes gene_type:complete
MATHASRRTDKTGKDFEHFCEHLLSLAGHNVEEQVNIGLRPTGGAHNTDLIFEEKIIISLKYQDVAGTAEEKIPYEQMCLQHACETYGYTLAFVVLAGPGWKHDQSYRDDVFSKWMNTPNVFIINFDEFLEEFDLWETYLQEVI